MVEVVNGGGGDLRVSLREMFVTLHMGLVLVWGQEICKLGF